MNTRRELENSMRGGLNARRKDMKKMAVRKDGLSNTITSVTKDNMLYEEYDTDT